MAALKTNEHGATVLKRAGNSHSSFYPIFMHTLFAGLVPPFSDFFLAVLERYQIQVLHLHPNSILVLAIFAYLCEAYIGIPPSVDLFRSFYALRFMANKERSGCVSFCITDGMKGVYIPIALASGLTFGQAYPVIAWLAWVPNLVLAQRLVRSPGPI